MQLAGGFDRLLQPAPGPLSSRPAPGVAVSVSLHLAFLAAALVFGFARQQLPPAQAVPVTLVTLQPAPTNASPIVPPVLAAVPSPGVLAQPVPPSAEPDDGMIKPSIMLSGHTLADPRSRQAREALATVSTDERGVQLCNLEAMDQIHAWNATLRPERIVAYARRSETVVGDTIRAEGAAFRSADIWFDLTFACRLSGDHQNVIAFAFAVGKPVPRVQWEALDLPSGADADE